MIDFPQMVSVSHRNAQMYVMSHLCTIPQYSSPVLHAVFLVCLLILLSFRYFDRDIECIFKFFRKRLVTILIFFLYIICSQYVVADTLSIAESMS